MDWIEPSYGSLGLGIFACGEFTTVGSNPANRIAFWDGSVWSPLGGGLTGGGATSMAIFDDGSGAGLYVGGWFTSVGSVQSSGIARWDGAQWLTFGSGLSGGSPSQINIMATHNDGTGPALYVAGSFASIGGVPASGVAKWNGSTWAPLGGPNPWILALASFDDGSGPKLYAGGSFSTISGVQAQGVARWDGARWEALGSGLSGGYSVNVSSFAVFDDGNGPEMYAGGNFTASGTTPLHWIARWNGSDWLDVAGGVSNGSSFGFVEQLLVFDDGFGPALYVCGEITSAGGQPVRGITRYRRGAWTAVGGSAGGSVYAMNSWTDGPTPSLYVGGAFSTLGTIPARSIGRWTSCPPCYPNCDLSTTTPTLNVGDFICFLNRFAAADSYANCDQSTIPPALNIADFACFVNRFAEGCS